MTSSFSATGFYFYGLIPKRLLFSVYTCKFVVVLFLCIGRLLFFERLRLTGTPPS